jgi:hypothetical protein
MINPQMEYGQENYIGKEYEPQRPRGYRERQYERRKIAPSYEAINARAPRRAASSPAAH